MGDGTGAQNHQTTTVINTAPVFGFPPRIRVMYLCESVSSPSQITLESLYLQPAFGGLGDGVFLVELVPRLEDVGV